MDTTTDVTPSSKQRHGCVTAWLILMIISNSASALIYIFANELIAQGLPEGIPSTMLFLLIILSVGNVIFSIMLFNWQKLGFWGFVATSIGALIININIGLGFGQSLLGLAGIAILYGVLQIKKGDVAAWTNLE